MDNSQLHQPTTCHFHVTILFTCGSQWNHLDAALPRGMYSPTYIKLGCIVALPFEVLPCACNRKVQQSKGHSMVAGTEYFKSASAHVQNAASSTCYTL